MFLLTRPQLLAADDWLPIQDGFGREALKPFAEGLDPIVAALRKRHWLEVQVEARGGMENFSHVFVHDKQLYPQVEELAESQTRRWNGVSIYLSLLGPLAAIGYSSTYMTHFKHPEPGKAIGIGGAAYLSPKTTLDAPPPGDTVVEAAFNEVHRHGYHVLTQANLALPLPPDIEPYDPSGLASELTYFDLLFNSTD